MLAGLVTALSPAPVFAQAASAIAGVVHDTSGAVLPGVTVEASSPALIERVRTVTTDSQGQYRIIDLRPGTYAVTFTLTGFATVRREGIELTAQFTASVNADMRVGALEETITVSGASPVVDTQNVIKRQVVQKDVIDAMPTSKNWSTIGVMTIGVFSNQNDVGGSAGEHQNQLKAHGGSFNDRLVQLDGLMLANFACAYSCTGLSTNDASTQELSYEFGAISAETGSGGVRVNIIPKEGGNRYSGSVFGNFANDNLQGNNIDQELRDQGVQTADSIKKIYDTNVAFGGPLKKDKLWFWTAHRFWGYEQIRTNTFYEGNPFDFVFDPDYSRPGTESQTNVSDDLRLTWQMTPRNKLSVYYNFAPRHTNNWTLVSTIQPDAAQFQSVSPNHFETFTFRSTISPRLLFEAAAGNLTETWTREPNPDSLTSNGYPVTEQNTGINFRAYSATFSRNFTSVRSYRSSLSYVTGSHAVKVGFTDTEGPAVTDVYTSYDTALTVRNGVPFSVTVRTTPYTARERLIADLGLYAQDTWTVKRLTVNAGLRFDYMNSKVDAQDATGGTWIGPRHFDEVNHVPLWTDLGPRLGAAYDLFGNGKTAVKATLSRYILSNGLAFARTQNPFNTTTNTATRTWNDTIHPDGIPQVDELGPLGSTFGQVIVSTHYDPETITGFAKRRSNWEFSTSLTQELVSRVSAEVAYFRRSQGHFTVTDNLKVGPQDYDQYCVTAPTDPRLGDVSGTRICGLYDLNPAKFGAAFVDNLVTFADNYGKQIEVFNGVDFSVNARIRSDLFVTGGFSTGDIHTNNCDVIPDTPERRFCDTHTSYLTQAKVSGSYTVPKVDIQLGGVLQNLPGQQITASWSVISSQAEGLNRAFSGGGSRTVQLIEPGTMYTPRRTQIDLRLSRSFKVGGTKRVQVMADIYNLTNSNASVGATSNAGEPPAAINTTYGSAWLSPRNILQARYVKFGAQLNF
jgi:hypothetical protein